jgi:hypothetical protein
MVEFTIIFRFNEKDQKAGVVRSENDDTVEYVIRPIDPHIVQKYGKQVIIFKENGEYNCNTHIDENHRDFFDVLVNALKVQDIANFQI